MLPRHVLREPIAVRAWSERDAVPLKDAIDTSLEHLRAWRPWAWREPSSLDHMRRRLAAYERHFVAGVEWRFGMFSDDESVVVGGCGVHRYGVGRASFEIGYWVRASATRRGFARAAVNALLEAAFGTTDVEALDIRCDCANVGSAAVARSLGFERVDRTTESGDVMVWRMTRSAFARGPKNTNAPDPKT